MRTTLSTLEIGALQTEFSRLPSDYFQYLAEVGWGESDSGRMIYSGPIKASEIFGAAFQASPILLLGDDMQGYCFGYDPDEKEFGEISDFGEWHPWPHERVFSDYTTA